MHMTLILGAVVVTFLDAPRLVSILLVALKTAVDLRAHRKEHAEAARSAA